MELLQPILGFFSSDWFLLIVAAFAPSGIIAHAVAISPTKKDDAAFPYVKKFIDFLAGNYGNAKNQ